MLLSEVHEQLCAAEFSLIIDGDGDTLRPESLPKINAIIQAGINDLNKRFAVRENELLLRVSEDKNVYRLTVDNAISNNPNGFIIDSDDDPFLGDVMQIVRINDSTGASMWLNTDIAAIVPQENIYGTRPSIYTNKGINMLAYDTLKFHRNHTAEDLLVTYKAKLKPMDLRLSPENVIIDLPEHFLNALVLYTVTRKYNPKGAETIGRGMFHEGNNYWTKFIEEIADLKANLGSIASTGESTNFNRNGWA